MEGNFPWGGYGVNPRPSTWEAYERRHGALLAGGFPYSEGIFEDLNKVLTLQLGWDPDRASGDIVREYAAYAFSPEVAGDVVDIVRLMEAGLDHSLHDDVRKQIEADDVRSPDDLLAKPLYRWVDRPNALLVAAVVAQVERALPPRVRQTWRWRLLWLRAAIDAEMQRSGGRSTELLERCFDELTEHYHAEDGLLAVTPPSRKALYRIIKPGRDLEPT